MGSALPLYTSSLPSPPPSSSSPSPIDSPPSYQNNMSQTNLHEVIRQQEQIATMQAQIQALLVAVGGGGTRGARTGTNVESHMEVAKPAIFNGEAEKVGGFITVCRLFLRMKLREATVEE